MAAMAPSPTASAGTIRLQPLAPSHSSRAAASAPRLPMRLLLPALLALLASGWGPRRTSAFLPKPHRIEHPAMDGYDSTSLPQWNTIIMGETRKVYVPGKGRRALNASVLVGHPGGLFDSIMLEHQTTVCGKGSCQRKRCALTRGDWCKDYYNQDPIPWRAPPRGDKDCPGSPHGPCNGVGSCQHDIGVCLCPAGWSGDDCQTRDLRPCTNRYRHQFLDGANTTVRTHAGPDGRDRNWSEPGWTASRCAGYCDDDIATCFCPPGTKFGRVLPPPGSPPGTPPPVEGRPIGDSCKPNKDPANDNKKTDWGNIDPDDMFGPDGWCNSDSPRTHCGCVQDGRQGHLCRTISEAFCYNQCTGHGECLTGFCKCHEGWYGMDCSRQRASAKERKPGYHEPGGGKPYLESVVVNPPASLDPPPHPTRRRPLIYVYDTDPLFNTRMMQYRVARSACAYRLFGEANDTNFNPYVYSLESYWIEMLSVSQHRTYDPDEADFFFVPVQLTCYLWPVLGWADHPWFGQPAAHSRSHQGSMMYLQAKRWVQKHYPFWDRRGGKDHIWMMLNDEGACWMPTEIFNTSIVLSHWGRMDEEHISGTAWGYDNYTHPLDPWPPYTTGDQREVYYDHPCYTPGKDLVIPSLKPASHFAASPLLGAPPFQRDILLYLRGDTGPYRAHWYSRGIRQRLAKLAYKHSWADRHRMFIGESWQISGSYSEHLARSLFCLVVPGDGWSARAEDAILHGCIPLVIMDGIHAVFESLLEWDTFSLRIAESAVDEHLPEVLKAVSPEQLERMQRRLATVWQRFAYSSGSLLAGELHRAYESNKQERQKAYTENVEAADAAGKADAAAAAKLGPGLLPGGKPAALQRGGGGAGGPHGGAGADAGEWLGPPGHPYASYTRFPGRTDAWNTIMAWLYSRIPHTR